jgi:hypothetical protein
MGGGGEYGDEKEGDCLGCSIGDRIQKCSSKMISVNYTYLAQYYSQTTVFTGLKQVRRAIFFLAVTLQR